ncbi:flavin-containing monooxygenase FMO GS-OX5-like protein [Tanacetum coccineum]
MELAGSKGSRWRLGAISRNLAELEDHQGSYLSIHDQPAVPLKGHLCLIKDQNGYSDLEMGITRLVLFSGKSHRIVRTWAYDPRVESDLLRLNPNRDIGQGSLYKSMQTNLPHELMSFTDFKFSEKVYDDPRTYPGHE